MTLMPENLSPRLKAAAPLFPARSITVGAGQVGTVMAGPGVGKSTLLDAVVGHLEHGFCCAGQITLNGRPLNGLPPAVKERKARRAAVMRAPEQAGLIGMTDRDPATLSGGQRTRTALMRTLLAGSLAQLLDEPFSKLDSGLRAEMQKFTFSHIRTSAIPALMVTHDATDARMAGGPIVKLEASACARSP